MAEEVAVADADVAGGMAASSTTAAQAVARLWVIPAAAKVSR